MYALVTLQVKYVFKILIISYIEKKKVLSKGTARAAIVKARKAVLSLLCSAYC